MAPGISLCLVLHNHQPVGNFGWVIEDVWTRAYAPMIDALERHPAVRVGLHYSGPLLDWIESEHASALDRIRAMADRGQVEILGGGLTEPILVALTEADRQVQLVRMGDRVEALFGVRPRGAWLAERVWEPSLPADLAMAGYAYTILDDTHLRAAHVPEDGMWGTYSTDDQGHRLILFGSEQGLRYHIPWSPVEQVIAHLRTNATEGRERVGVMGDDGEKFGGWPGTDALCWGRDAWMEHFLVALEENAGWLTTVRPSDWLERGRPQGRVYVPNSSYVEMTEWALPADEAGTFHGLITRAREQGLPEARFLSGAAWRNFQARYREINDLHKQMLRTSAAVAAMAPGPARDRAGMHLLRGQSNDAYWHGLFGGIYLTHLRQALQAELIAAEDLAEAGAPRTRRADFDLDGYDEVLLGAPGHSALVDVEEGAGIGAWDLWASRVALASVLRRRPEAYHGRLAAHLAELAAAAAAGAAGVAAGAAGVADPGAPTGVTGEAGRANAASDAAGTDAAGTDSAGTGTPAAPESGGADAETASGGVPPLAAPESYMVKDEGLAELLVYDRHELRGGLVTLHDLASADGVGPRELAAVADADLGDFADGPFEVLDLTDGHVTVRRLGRVAGVALGAVASPLSVTKAIALSGDRRNPVLDVAVTLSNPGRAELAFELDLSFGWNVAGGGHNLAAFYTWIADGAETSARHDTSGDLADSTGLSFGNRDFGLAVTARLSRPGRISWFSIDTVSNSEAGYERVYQGSSLHLRWPVHLRAGGEDRVGVRFSADQSRDLAAEEGALP